MDFLTKIVEHKKIEIKERSKLVAESLLRDEVIKVKKRPFMKKLSEPGQSGINVIAEIKRASPSKGFLHPDLDPAEYAADYEKGGAAAISVLTDRDYFKGSSNDLIRAREASSLPVLRKDFIISSYQIYETSAMGADALLLIARILSKQQIKDYLALSTELVMDTLVEVHSEKDLETASDAGAKLIGINNRNLSSFETDPENAMRIAGLLEPGQIAVAASGIKGRRDIEKNLSSGIYNFLIGESIVTSGNPVEFIKSLLARKQD
ncbi:MAG: indole-3-glycerol phosphate synthase TrpC [Proteobacteria bacterium]|nr:indole-3-glycerol phosphate synthase TrpC [Pseudomonadota bacterium]MBU1712554.1 indole-3-glycerol phosphate synthase TrpC [Pseudomonadota bacterium]